MSHPRRVRRWPALLLLLALAAVAFPGSAAASELLVAAAANLGPAFREILPAFERQRGVGTRLTLGSTGQLRQQIEYGAPYDIFFAADEASVRALAARGLMRPEDIRIYAIGTLVLAWTTGGRDFTGLRDLCRETVRRVAIANPVHAPYGKAAEEALRHADAQACVAPKLVYGESVAQAFQFLLTGNVDAALLPAALTTRPEIREARVDRSLYPPIVQAAGVLVRSPRADEARALLRFVVAPEGRAILERFGYQAPAGS